MLIFFVICLISYYKLWYYIKAVRELPKPDFFWTEPDMTRSNTMRHKVHTSNGNGYSRNNCKTKNHEQLQPFYKQRRLFVGRFKESRRHYVGCNNFLNALFVDLVDWETGRKCDYSWVMQKDWPNGKRAVADMRPGKTWTFSGVVDIYDTKGFDDYNITLVEQPLLWEDWNEVMDVCDDMGFHGPPPEYGNITTAYDYSTDSVPE